jgi:hypothetical protein
MRQASTITALCLALSASAIARAGFEQFDIPDARLTRPFGLNASGQIVGLYRDPQNVNHGFLLRTDGTYAPIDYPGAIFTNATSINARGDIVGRWMDTAGFNHGYLLRNGVFESVDPIAPCVVTKQATVIHGINDIGDLVGRCFDAIGKELGWLWRHDGSFQAFDHPNALTTDVWMVTNTGVVVGDYTDTSGFVHGFTWTEGGGYVTVDYPDSQTGLRDMTEHGDITGIYVDGAERFHGFLLRNGIFATVDYPGAANGGGTLVINARGDLVGAFIDGAGSEHGFILRR